MGAWRRHPAGGGLIRAALGRLLAVLALALSGASAAASDCVSFRVDVRGEFGVLRFAVELADDPQERSRGLMFRERLPRYAGMLFVYERPGPASFWMKNTLIPLDMLFADAQGRVIRIHENAVPGDLTPIRAEGPILAVLEINGGLAADLGIMPGAEIRHPAFGPDAAWPCD